MKVRIAKFISDSGVTSRRGAEQMIASRCVLVNGVAAKTPVLFVDENDEIVVNGKKIEPRTNTELYAFHKPIDTVSIIVNSVLMTCALIGYILLGFFWKERSMGWTWGWVLFLVAITLGSILNAIKEKKMCNFTYPLLVVAIYVTLGFFGDYFGFSGWHPYWFIFITIPVYYVIGSQVDKAIHKNDPVDPDGDKD